MSFIPGPGHETSHETTRRRPRTLTEDDVYDQDQQIESSTLTSWSYNDQRPDDHANKRSRTDTIPVDLQDEQNDEVKIVESVEPSIVEVVSVAPVASSQANASPWLESSFAVVKSKIQAIMAQQPNPLTDPSSDYDMERILAASLSSGEVSPELEQYAEQYRAFVHNFDQLYRAFALDNLNSQNTLGKIQYLAKLYRVWDTDRQTLKIVEYARLQELYKSYNKRIKDIYLEMKKLNLNQMQTARGPTHTYEREWARMSRMIYEGYVTLCAWFLYESDRAISSEQKWTLENVEELKSFTNTDKIRHVKLKKDNNFRIIFNMCLSKVKQLKLVRRDEWFLRERQMEGPDGILYGTSYYEKFCEIKKLLADMQAYGQTQQLFDLYWGAQGIKSAVDNCLMFSQDCNLVDYKIMYGVVAFKSHLYYAPHDQWWSHWDPHKPTQFMAITYIDSELDTRPVVNSCMDLAYDAVTGELNPIVSLFRTQEYSDMEIETVAAMFGRTLHEFRKDGRDFLIYCKGVAGSGKSSLLELLESFYDEDLVGIISNKGEEVFGLEAFQTKCLILAMDLTDKANIDVGVILNLTSGDKISVARKHLVARFMRILAHLVCSGNNFPANWIDNNGNFKRRMFYVDFRISPNPPDALFKEKVKRSGGNSYRFLNCAFLKMLHQLPSKADFWDHVPERFKRNRDEFLADTSCLLTWLSELEESKAIKFNKHAYWAYKDFEERFKKWCISNHRHNWHEEIGIRNMRRVLVNRKCEVKSNVRKLWPTVLSHNSPGTQRDYGPVYPRPDVCRCASGRRHGRQYGRRRECARSSHARSSAASRGNSTARAQESTSRLSVVIN